MGVHDGHRARVRQRILQEGMQHLAPHNVLEILLFFALPRGDTNALAHRILDAYHGDLVAVTEAPFEDLLKIEGVGENTAFLLKMIPEIAAYYRQARIKDAPALCTMESLRDYFVPLFYGKHNEELHLICMDASLRPLYDCIISEGTTTASAVNVRRIVEVALSRHAARVMLGHNHPSGNPRPSARDENTTRDIAAALRLVDIELTDHIIVAEESVYSMRQGGHIPPDDRSRFNY